MDNAPEKKIVTPDKKSLFFGDNNNFTMITNRIFSQGKYLTPQAKVIFITLRSFWNRDSEQIFPSYRRIEERSGLTRPTISKALNELEHFGWIIKQRRFSKSTNYNLVYPIINRPEPNGEISENKEWFICPTKQQAVEWKKAQAQKRNKSGGRSREFKPWATEREDDILDNEDIPF